MAFSLTLLLILSLDFTFFIILGRHEKSSKPYNIYNLISFHQTGNDAIIFSFFAEDLSEMKRSGLKLPKSIKTFVERVCMSACPHVRMSACPHLFSYLILGFSLLGVYYQTVTAYQVSV